MGQFSHGEAVLLALLTQGAAHGYELVRRLRSMEVARWAQVRESTLYASLRRLESGGYLTGEDRPGARAKARRTYSITSAGRARLKELIDTGLATPAPIHSDVLVAGLLGATIDEDIDLEAAIARIRGMKTRLAATLTSPHLSRPGEIVVRFYLGLADLQLEALAALREVAGSREWTALPSMSPERKG